MSKQKNIQLMSIGINLLPLSFTVCLPDPTWRESGGEIVQLDADDADESFNKCKTRAF